jgi:hypothetical protein
VKIVVSDSSLPVILIPGKEPMMLINNKQGQKINQIKIDFDECTENLSVVQKYASMGDSLKIQFTTLLDNLAKIDERQQLALTAYTELSEIQTQKFVDLQASWKKHTKFVKDKDKKTLCATLIPAFTINAVGFGLLARAIKNK